MNLIAILSVFLLKWIPTIAIVLETTSGLNKTKRTLADTATYGEKPTPIFYAIPDGTRPDFFATTKTFALAKPPLSAVFDPEVPKQVAAQQVLYEYQQTPTNAVSNVHVKQLFQPLEISNGNDTPQNTQTPHQPHSQNSNVHASETVVNPVQHSSLVNHGQNYAHVQFQPYYPQHTQTQHYIPGRYFYVNGKYVYPPIPAQPHYASQSQNQNVNAPQHNNKVPVSYITYGSPNNVPKQKLTPPPNGVPMNFNKFIAPTRQEIQQITKPVQPPPKVHEEIEDEEENSSLEKEDEKNEENEEEEDDKSNYEEGSDENDDHYGKYFEDEDEDRGHYREDHEEDEDDSDRKASRVVRIHKSPSKNRKNNSKKKSHNDKNNYAWSESYSHSSKYENGKKKSDKNKERSKYDTNKRKSGKRKNKSKKGGDRLEGRYSHNVPVVQEHNVFREKWYLSKSKNTEKKV
ncbi:hypothetical protein HHI36_007397 [Cryptolaemus montrouzieri]|uniref:Uncharacterized protein n=1 Tax=Cryptolaemus montrouzieri TaxID=559131 RepID=A0ABD2MPI4_9CUCU